MSADKHPAEVLADTKRYERGLTWDALADEQLRRIPALEYERDHQADRLEKLLAENDLLLRHRNGAEAAARSAVHRAEGLEAERDQQLRTITALMAGMPEDGTTPVIARIGRLEAERDRLTAILERWANASTPDGWIGQMVVDRDQLRAEVQRWSVLAASFEAERNLLREEVEALRADAERYRWLRDTPSSFDVFAEASPASMDKDIDAARKQQ